MRVVNWERLMTKSLPNLFEDANENIIEFNEVAPKILTQFKLKTDDLIDEAYSITYVITEKEDEDGFVFEENLL